MTPEDSKPVSRLAKLVGVLVALRAAWRVAGSGKPRAPLSRESESDADPARRTVPANRRAESLVAALLLAAAFCGFAFTAIYVILSGDTQLLGLSMGLSLLFAAAGAIVAGKFVVPQETAVEQRGVLLDERATEEAVELIESGERASPVECC